MPRKPARSAARMEIGAFVRMTIEAAVPRRPTGKRGAPGVRDDLVIHYKEKLEAALGDEEKFTSVYNDLRANAYRQGRDYCIGQADDGQRGAHGRRCVKEDLEQTPVAGGLQSEMPRDRGAVGCVAGRPSLTRPGAFGPALPALFFRSRHCLVLLTATTAPLSATTLLRTAPLSTATLELPPLSTATLDLRTAPLSAATLDLRTAPRSAATLELHTTTLAVAALNPDIATTSVALNFATATTSAVEFASTTPAVPALTATPA
jgi:hypothetical protein